jgi:hypothetical protein
MSIIVYKGGFKNRTASAIYAPAVGLSLRALDQIRTDDPPGSNQVLYPLSYERKVTLMPGSGLSVSSRLA